jgi:hypothetical protein
MHREPLSADFDVACDPVAISFFTACCKYQLRKMIE